ncbi:MAG: site-specific integrase [Actinomycetota bacterium]|nr:site-specific integrase [Actinomycetota bacterium]
MGRKAKGHLQVRGTRGRRRWHAFWSDADGRHQRVLGPAHVKDSGKRTARGGVIWKAADGPKRPGYLTPGDAREGLARLLAQAPTAPTAKARRRPDERTFGEAAEEWLRYVEHDKRRAVSTVRDYRNLTGCYLLPAFGAETALRAITTRSIDDWREWLLHEGRLSPRTVQKVQVCLYAILKRAKRKGWVSANVAEDAERITFKRSGDFNILDPAQVEQVARAASTPLHAAVITTAAYTGLRMGELLALRWRDVDFARATVHVRRAITRGEEGAPKSGKVRSVPLVDQAAQVLDELSQRETFTAAGDRVFSTALGEPLTDAEVRQTFYDALTGAGLGDLRTKPGPMVFHDLRHSFGSLAVQVFPLADVKAFMGHADIATTMIYVHHVPQHDAAAKLSSALRERASTEGKLLTAAQETATIGSRRAARLRRPV